MPQLRIEGAVYFATWRLNDPQDRLSEAEREIVAQAIQHFNEQRYRLAAYVVMHDHVHVVLQPLPAYGLGSILHSLKSFTAKEINKARSAQGTRWMKDSHTRVIRSETELRNTIKYVVDNPRKRWPDIADYPWAQWLDVL